MNLVCIACCHISTLLHRFCVPGGAALLVHACFKVHQYNFFIVTIIIPCSLLLNVF